MTNVVHIDGQSRRGDYVVRAPRRSDALGHALRGVFAHAPLPDDMQRLLRRLEHVGG